MNFLVGLFRRERGVLLLITFFFIILALLLGRGVFFSDGELYSRDFVYASGYYDLPVSSWNEHNSAPFLQANKVPLNYLLNQLNRFFGLDPGTVYLFFTLFLVPTIFFFIAYAILKKYFNLKWQNALIPSLSGAFIYLFNPWVLDRVSNHINMVLSMSFLPLLLYLYFKLVIGRRNKCIINFKYLSLLSIVLTLYTSISSHNIFYIFPLLFLFVVLYWIFSGFKNTLYLLITNATFAVIYLFLNIYWLLPTVTKITDEAIEPSYNYGIENLESISSRNNVLNILQGRSGGAWDSVLTYSDSLIISVFQMSLSVLIVIIVFFTFLIFREKVIFQIRNIFFVILVLLCAGAYAPIPIYEYLFNSPLNSIMWLYRDPSRIVQFLILIFSINVVVFSIYTSYNKGKVWGYVLLIIVLLSPSTTTFFQNGGGYLVASKVSEEFDLLNAELSADEGDFKVERWPKFGYFFYEWSNTPSVTGDVISTLLPKPFYADTSSAGSKLSMIKYLYNRVFEQGNTNSFGSILNLLDIKYVVVNNDLVKSQENASRNILRKVNEDDTLKIKSNFNDKYSLYSNTEYNESHLIYSLGQIRDNDDLYNTVPQVEILDLCNLTIEYQNVQQENCEPFSLKAIVNSDYDEYGFNFDLLIDDLNLYEKFNIKIKPSSINTGTELNVVLHGSTEIIGLNRYSLELGEENELNFNLNGILSKYPNADLKKVEIRILKETPYGEYYQYGDNKFDISEISFTYDDAYGALNPDEVVADLVNISKKVTTENLLITDYIKISDTNYKFKVETKDSVTLAFAKGYDSSWIMELDNDNCSENIINSRPLFGVINGFDLNCLGESNISIKYAPEKYLKIGLIVSGIFTFLLVLSMIVAYSKGRKFFLLQQ